MTMLWSGREIGNQSRRNERALVVFHLLVCVPVIYGHCRLRVGNGHVYHSKSLPTIVLSFVRQSLSASFLCCN